jgi:hypothetical protein
MTPVELTVIQVRLDSCVAGHRHARHVGNAARVTGMSGKSVDVGAALTYGGGDWPTWR